MKAISVHNLHKHYGQLHVLRGLTLEITRGECVILLGANGCGKSTLMRCLNGLTSHDQGEITILGDSLTHLSKPQLRQLRRKVGVVFQQFNLVQNVSVFQNVLYGAMGQQRFGLLASLACLATHELRERAMASLERVGLAHKAHADCRQLSGGQQQRVAIARTLMQDAEIIIADEPIASLDPKAGKEIMDLLLDVVSERRLTVLCTLHQLELAQQYGDRIIGMKAGQIVLDTPRQQVALATMQQLYQGDVRVDQISPPTVDNAALPTS
ncbi:phosphonate ABC transporter ATP-binding protein [Vreelandella sedimenti]|jgi:phosphonate transport system ATP-binding protein|uniref:phosphonate ABC transporter ATP-binding protein n=1 Tax=Vreelandella sedimenti TaxID=2729618 RepID=UPI00257C97D8|nr:phosphonate ABC transporter ATP-binding protein [Halomonas sp. UBA3173]|tara:strand:+ start:70195 stop:70998 length:804 start_codon:yes stop_codon:yes gene_type:complete